MEGPASEVRGARLVEAPLRCGVVGCQERACVAQVQRGPDRWSRARRRLHLRQQRPCPGDAVGVQGSLREVGDEPAGHDGVVRRIGRVEQPPRRLVGVVMPALSQRAQHAAELREGDGDPAAGGETEPLGAGGTVLGGPGVAPHARDQGQDGLAARDPERCPELGREPPRLLPGGNGDVPRPEERGDDAVENEHPGQLAQPSLGTRTVGGGREQADGDVEGAEHERRGPQVPHRLRVQRACGHGLQRRQGLGRVVDRVGTGVGGEHARIRVAGAAEPSGGVDENASGGRSGSVHQAREAGQAIATCTSGSSGWPRGGGLAAPPPRAPGRGPRALR